MTVHSVHNGSADGSRHMQQLANCCPFRAPSASLQILQTYTHHMREHIMMQIRSSLRPRSSVRLNLTAKGLALSEKKVLNDGNHYDGGWLQRLAGVRILALGQMRALNPILLF